MQLTKVFFYQMIVFVAISRLCNCAICKYTNSSVLLKMSCIQGAFEKYQDCMLCSSNVYNSDKSFVFEDSTMSCGCKNVVLAFFDNHMLFHRLFIKGALL